MTLRPCRLVLPFLGCALLFLSACGDDAGDCDCSTPTSEPSPAVDAVWPGDEWEITEPASQGMEAASLEDIEAYCVEHNCRGVVVARHGRIVWERYWGGWTEASTDNSWSMAKSVTSALVGIAIDEGKIEGLDQSASDFIPEWRGSNREEITIRHLLSMATGLEWAMLYDPPSGDTATMLGQEDEVAYALDREVYRAPGSDWYYSDGDVEVVGHILKVATGMEASEYAQKKLFGPIGFEMDDWSSDNRGQTLTYCCIRSTARDFARFGYLYLREGKWGEQQVVPAEWVKESTQPSQFENMNYGYYWWLVDFPGAPEDLYAAMGYLEKRIYVMPSLDIVAVRLGEGDENWDDAAFLRPIVDAARE